MQTVKWFQQHDDDAKYVLGTAVCLCFPEFPPNVFITGGNIVECQRAALNQIKWIN